MPERSIRVILAVLAALLPASASAVEISSGAVPISNPTSQSARAALTVSGVPGIATISVRLNSLNHQRPDDLDIVVVGPSSFDRVMLMSDAGGFTASTSTVTFSQSAGGTIPDGGPFGSGSYRPTNIGTSDTFNFPGPGTLNSPSVNLDTTFIGENPNGMWNLYIVDDDPLGVSLASLGSWTLILTPPPPPANDAFASAEIIVDGALPLTGAGATWGAGIEGSEPDLANGDDAFFTTWHAWTPTTSGQVVITATGFDTVLDVFTGADVTALTQVAGNDDNPISGASSGVLIEAVAGTTYWLRVDGYQQELGTYTLTIATPPAPALAATASLSVIRGVAMSQHRVKGAYAATWDVVGLPPGLAFDDGYITGTATASGTFPVSITATNSAGSSTQVLTISVTAPPEITSVLYVSTTLDQPFTYTITGSNDPTTFAASPLPPGLSFDAATGVISGTPTAVGVYDIDITASNAWGDDDQELELHVNPVGAPAFDRPVVARGVVGRSFYAHLPATNDPTSRWADDDTFPPGIEFDEDYGTLYGTPTQAGEWVVLFWAENAQGEAYGTMRVIIDPAPAAGASSADRPTCGFGSLALIGLALAAARRRRRA